MIQHTILFDVNEPKEESRQRVVNVLAPLGDGRIPSVVSLTLRPNGLSGPAAADLGMFAIFHDFAGLTEYLQHPEHLAAVAGLQPYVARASMIDFDDDEATVAISGSDSVKH